MNASTVSHDDHDCGQTEFISFFHHICSFITND